MMWFLIVSGVTFFAYGMWILHRDDDFDLKNVSLFALLAIFSPFSWGLCGGVFIYYRIEREHRVKAKKILHKYGVLNFNDGPNNEKHYEIGSLKTTLGDIVRKMDRSEIKFLLGISTEIFEINKVMRAALIDELICRDLLNG